MASFVKLISILFLLSTVIAITFARVHSDNGDNNMFIRELKDFGGLTNASLSGIEEPVAASHGYLLKLSFHSGGGGWITVLITLFVNLLLVIGALVKEKYDRKQEDQRKEEEEHRVKLAFFESNGGFEIQDKFLIFSINEVSVLTDNYNPARRLGDEDTFKCILVTEPVIVKRGIKVPKMGVPKFLNIMQMLYEGRHRNIVRVLGGCFECCCPAIVFEYVGDSVKQLLPTLSWSKRFHLIKDIAMGLQYLQNKAIHGNLNPTCIFMDKDNVGKIGMLDFSTNLRELSVYSDPSIGSDKFQIAADVYSFGVIVCEIVTGISPASSSPNQYTDLLELNQDDFIAQIDKGPGSVEAIAEPLKQMLRLAVQCTVAECHLRPSMDFILEIVEGTLRDFTQISALNKSGASTPLPISRL